VDQLLYFKKIPDIMKHNCSSLSLKMPSIGTCSTSELAYY